jgi:hypothetical protein
LAGIKGCDADGLGHGEFSGEKVLLASPLPRRMDIAKSLCQH